MFFVKELTHEIVLEPIHFGPKLRSTIVRLVKEQVEGLALANYGFVINVIEVPEDKVKSGIIEYVSTFFPPWHDMETYFSLEIYSTYP